MVDVSFNNVPCVVKQALTLSVTQGRRQAVPGWESVLAKMLHFVLRCSKCIGHCFPLFAVCREPKLLAE